MNKLLLALPALALLAAASKTAATIRRPAGSSAQITGAGSTFVYPVLSAWAADYQKQTGTDDQLSVDRFGRRHFAGQGRHRRFRRDRPAARHR